MCHRRAGRGEQVLAAQYGQQQVISPQVQHELSFRERVCAHVLVLLHLGVGSGHRPGHRGALGPRAQAPDTCRPA